MEPHGTCVAFVWPRPLRPEVSFPVAAGLSVSLARSLSLSAAFRTAKRRKRTSGGRLARFSNPGAPRVRDGDGAWRDATRGELLGKGDSCGGALGRISYLSSGSDWHAPRPWWDRLWFSMPRRGRKANVREFRVGPARGAAGTWAQFAGLSKSAAALS